MTPDKRIWIAHAPAGRWSTGPVVVHWSETALAYVEMGWRVDGPYVLETAQGDI